MTIRTITSRAGEADPSALDAALREIESGRVVLAATETVYGLAVDASKPEALEALWAARGGERSALAWHAPDSARVIETAGVKHPAHRLLLQRLMPGPVLFAIELDDGALARARGVLGVAPGVIDDGSALLVRAPSGEPARSLSRGFAGTLVMAAPIVARAQDAADFDQAMRAVRARGDASRVALAIDSGRTALGKPSTLVRLTRGGGYAVEREGALEARHVDKALEYRVLFVCSGNTCRSPMAEAIARDVLKNSAPGGIRIKVSSAGTMTDDGAPATAEAVEALRGMGIELRGHASRRLTRQMLREADAVFTMTRGHAGAVRSIDSEAAARAAPMDPDGNDVPDPIGHGAEEYKRTALMLRRAVERRLGEVTLARPVADDATGAGADVAEREGQHETPRGRRQEHA